MAKPIRPTNTAIEPTQMRVPTMDRPSLAFAWFLDSIVLDYDDEHNGLLLTCSLCGDGLCAVEAADTLRVLLNTALAHTC